MRAILLAAGLGTRLRPLTDILPKCLAPVRGRPLLEYWLSELFAHGVSEVVVNTHYHADLVVQYVERGPWRHRVRLAYEPRLLGTGGTVRAHREFVSGGPFLVAHADNLSAFHMETFAAAHAARPPAAMMTMMTFDTAEPRNCGIVETNAGGLVTAFYEKVPNPPGNRANGAVYLCEPGVLDMLAAVGKPVVDLSTESIPLLMGQINAWHNAVYHRDIGSLESWRAAQGDYPFDPPRAPLPDPWAELLVSHPEIARRISHLLDAGS